MKSNKGISMISLIVTIICILIFIGLSYRIGSRYIKESKEEEKSSLIAVISDAVIRRQNDKYISVGAEKIYYSGYPITEEEFNQIMSSGDYEWGNGLWFIVDAKSAEDLGIVDSKQYLVEDLTKPKTDADDDKYIAIVDYDTGKVELVYYDGKVEKDTFNKIAENAKDDETGCTHAYSVVSCIEPSVCAKCGRIFSHALGHDFNVEHATCTKNKKCNRCGYIAEKAVGHEYDTSILSYDNEGHFNKCVRYAECGAVGNFKSHTREYGYIEGNEWKHNVRCTFEGCNWTMIEECKKAVRTKDISKHIVYCENCGRSEEVDHDNIKYKYIDKEKHMLCCDTCKGELYKEEHIDEEKPFGICDKCDGAVDLNKEPVIEILVMENITPEAPNKYYAKYGDTIKVTLKSSLLLVKAPTIKIQNQTISVSEIYTDDDFTWYAEFKTSDYPFENGNMSIVVSDIETLWGVSMFDIITETTDKNYIAYDSVKPEYIYVQ